MKNKRYFPLYVDLSDKNIVVVGGGTIGHKKSESIIIIYQEYYSNRAEDDSRSLGTGQAGKIQIQPRPVKNRISLWLIWCWLLRITVS